MALGCQGVRSSSHLELSQPVLEVPLPAVDDHAGVGSRRESKPPLLLLLLPLSLLLLDLDDAGGCECCFFPTHVEQVAHRLCNTPNISCPSFSSQIA